MTQPWSIVPKPGWRWWTQRGKPRILDVGNTIRRFFLRIDSVCFEVRVWGNDYSCNTISVYCPFLWRRSRHTTRSRMSRIDHSWNTIVLFGFRNSDIAISFTTPKSWSHRYGDSLTHIMAATNLLFEFPLLNLTMSCLLCIQLLMACFYCTEVLCAMHRCLLTLQGNSGWLRVWWNRPAF